jgi:hypothetical protein
VVNKSTASKRRRDSCGNYKVVEYLPYRSSGDATEVPLLPGAMNFCPTLRVARLSDLLKQCDPVRKSRRFSLLWPSL